MGAYERRTQPNNYPKQRKITFVLGAINEEDMEMLQGVIAIAKIATVHQDIIGFCAKFEEKLKAIQDRAYTRAGVSNNG